MLHLDDVQLYVLSEAGPLLFKDPVRLTREARLRAIPAAQVGADLGLPAPWVDAEAGLSDADPISLAGYWLQRLAPPLREARRPVRTPDRLPQSTWLTAEEAASRLFATPPALERLDRDGTLPSLRIDGQIRYDATLVELVAAQDDDAAARARAAARRAEIRELARFEYAAAAPARPVPPSTPPPASAPTTAKPSPEAPRAYELPADLGFTAGGAADEDPGAWPPPSTLLDVEGFETLDED